MGEVGLFAREYISGGRACQRFFVPIAYRFDEAIALKATIASPTN
jgi:hypothetical protein